jgi:hypothetical protein
VFKDTGNLIQDSKFNIQGCVKIFELHLGGCRARRSGTGLSVTSPATLNANAFRAFHFNPCRKGRVAMKC